MQGTRKSMLALLAAAAFAVTFVAAPVLAHDEKSEAKDTTVKGEILDLACYVGHGAHGASHAGCAASCLKGGQPMGLLGTDGTVYILFADHDDGAPFNQAKDLAGKNVEVTGAKEAKGALQGITVHGVKAL
jgi:hypothetical protein